VGSAESSVLFQTSILFLLGTCVCGVSSDLARFAGCAGLVIRSASPSQSRFTVSIFVAAAGTEVFLVLCSGFSLGVCSSQLVLADLLELLLDLFFMA
jgi:hypothetical protein